MGETFRSGISEWNRRCYFFVGSFMRLLALLGLTAATALAGPFSFGLRAGVPLTDFVNAVSTSDFQTSTLTNRYIIGPSVELRLPFGFGVEFDALYRHFSYTSQGVSTSPTLVFIPNRTTTGAWEFPLTAKYRFPSRIARPYLEAGVAWDKLSGLTATFGAVCSPQSCLPGGGTTSQPPELQKTGVAGFVVGGGVDIHLLFLHISPDIRYTRWGSQHLLSPDGLIQSDQNQVEFLVGMTF